MAVGMGLRSNRRRPLRIAIRCGPYPRGRGPTSSPGSLRPHALDQGEHGADGGNDRKTRQQSQCHLPPVSAP